MLESNVKDEVKKRIKAAAPNAHVFMPVQSGFGAPDLDFIVSVNGWALRIETKVDHKMPSARQSLTIAALVKAGVVVLILDQYNLSDLDTTLSFLVRGQQKNAFEYAELQRAEYIQR